jgi:hypothetical protein
MRKLIVGFLGVFLSALIHGEEEIPYLAKEYDSSKWPLAVLNLSKTGTLKDLFDSGLRPYRHPGLEKTTLEVKHLNLSIHLDSGKKLPSLPVELINVKMFSDGNISTFDGFTPKLTLTDARAEMMKWLPFSANGRTEADLNAYLKKVEADYIDFDDPYRGDPSGCGIGWREPDWETKGGGPDCSVWFRKSMSETHPLKLYFSFSWRLNRPSKEARSYRFPIPPPPGYEHVSMEAPDNFGPDSTDDILRSQGVDIGESPEARRAYEEAKKEAATERPEKRQPGASSESSDAITEKSAPFPWWFIASSVVILVLMLAGWLKVRKAKPTS